MSPSAGFLWGSATAAHQVEGNNTLSDWWQYEHRRGTALERSGDAIDHYHRYPEDMALLADAGLNAYRFSLEWSRIEPAPGEFSRAELEHYRRMIDRCHQVGMEPLVTIHHFTNPAWFVGEGSWTAPTARDRFLRYVEKVIPILNGVEWVTTFNETNMLSMMVDQARKIAAGQRPTSGVIPSPNKEVGEVILRAHRSAVDLLRAHLPAKVGMTVAMQALTPTPGNEGMWKEMEWVWEDMYLEGARGDDYIGVQSYTSQPVDADGVVPHPPRPDNTQTGWAFRPDAVGIAIRHAHSVLPDTPILVTENGVAIADDSRRIEYTRGAVNCVLDAVDEGIDVRGYVHWSSFDNFEWGTWEPTFGLVEVDRQTFERHPKPSLAWLGEVARSNGANIRDTRREAGESVNTRPESVID